MYSKPRTQRSIPSRLNAVGPMKKIGCSLVRKNVRISEILQPRDPKTLDIKLGRSLTFASRRICATATAIVNGIG
jgi:hypothetical protein